MNGREHLLENVLSVLARAEEVAAEREQSRLVARDQDLEGGGVAPPDDGDQALIGLQPQQGGPRLQSDSSGVSEC